MIFVLRSKQCLYCSAFIHRPVAFRHLLKRQHEVEHFSWVDLPFHYQLNKLWKIAANGCRTTMKMDVSVKQLLAFELNSVRNANV